MVYLANGPVEIAAKVWVYYEVQWRCSEQIQLIGVNHCCNSRTLDMLHTTAYVLIDGCHAHSYNLSLTCITGL